MLRHFSASKCTYKRFATHLVNDNTICRKIERNPSKEKKESNDPTNRIGSDLAGTVDIQDLELGR